MRCQVTFTLKYNKKGGRLVSVTKDVRKLEPSYLASGSAQYKTEQAPWEEQ